MVFRPVVHVVTGPSGYSFILMIPQLEVIHHFAGKQMVWRVPSSRPLSGRQPGRLRCAEKVGWVGPGRRA